MEKARSGFAFEKISAMVGAITGAHVAAVAVALVFLVTGTRDLYAIEANEAICWTRDECLPPETAIVGNCNHEHCFSPGEGCTAGGSGKCYANPPPVNLTVSIGRSTQVLDAGDYIAKVYNYGTGVAGLVAGVMFIVGGFQYLTAGGSKKRLDAGKERIRDAMIGLLLVLGAYVILNTVNPDTLKLQMPKIPIVKRRLLAACKTFEMSVKCGDPFRLVRITGAPPGGPPETQFRIATAEDLASGVSTTSVCYGASCSKAASNDGEFRCRKRPGDSSPLPTEPSQCGQAPQAPYECAPCRPWIADCSSLGESVDCCSGFCGSDTGGMITDVVSGPGGTTVSSAIGNGTCTNGENGVTCQTGAHCRSGKCQTRMKNRCSSGMTGSMCNDDDECAPGLECVEHNFFYFCTPKTPGNYCDSSSDCADGYRCYGSCTGVGDAIWSAVTTGSTSPVCARCRPEGMDRHCANDGECPSGTFCNTHHGQKICSARTVGSPCRQDLGNGTGARGHMDCGPDGYCVNVLTDCSGSGKPGICTAGGIGDLCNSNIHCQSGHCYAGDVGPPVETVMAEAQNLCVDRMGYCVSGNPGSGCTSTSGCNAGSTCNANAHICVLTPGSCP